MDEITLVNKIYDYVLWPGLRPLLNEYKDLILNPNKRIMIHCGGNDILIFDYKTYEMHYVCIQDRIISQPVLVQVIDKKPIRSINWFDHTLLVVAEDSNLYCWDPKIQCNPLLPEKNNQNPFVRSKVKKVAIGTQHVLVLCDDNQGNSKQIVIYSWSEDNIFGQQMTSKPMMVEKNFFVAIRDIGCTSVNGSVVLDIRNNVHLWGTFNGKITDYVLTKLQVNIHSGIMHRLFITQHNICFMDTEHNVQYICYADTYLSSLRMLKAGNIKIEDVYAENTSPVALLISENQIYVWEWYQGNDRVYKLMMQSLPDAYCLHVHQSTPEPTSINYDETIFQSIQNRLKYFNNPAINHETIGLNNDELVLRTTKINLFQQLTTNCRQFKDLFQINGGYNANFEFSVIKFMSQFRKPIQYAFLYWLHSGLISISPTYLQEFDQFAHKVGCPKLLETIEQRQKQLK